MTSLGFEHGAPKPAELVFDERRSKLRVDLHNAIAGVLRERGYLENNGYFKHMKAIETAVTGLSEHLLREDLS